MQCNLCSTAPFDNLRGLLKHKSAMHTGPGGAGSTFTLASASEGGGGSGSGSLSGFESGSVVGGGAGDVSMDKEEEGRRTMDVCAVCVQAIEGEAKDCTGCDRVFCAEGCKPTGTMTGALWACGLCMEALPAEVDRAQKELEALEGEQHLDLSDFSLAMLNEAYYRLRVGKVRALQRYQRLGVAESLCLLTFVR